MNERRVHLQVATHELVQLLRQRFPLDEGYALFEQVSEGVRGAPRHADAIMVGIWPTRGNLITGFEVKISRHDFRRELKNPAKAEAIGAYCDRWYIVAANEHIAPEDELPPTWGLLVVDGSGKKLVTKRLALPMKPKPLSRGFLASILRRAFEVQDALERASFQRGIEKGVADGPAHHQQRMQALEAEKTRLEKRIKDFESASGVAIDDWNAGRIGDAVKLVMSEYFRAPKKLADLKREAEGLVDLLGKELAIAEELAGMAGERGRAKLREAARR